MNPSFPNTPSLSSQIYLAMEQREANGELKAMTLVSEFAKKFRNIEFSVHPSDIPGEAAGKGSNVAWAARKASEKYPMAMRKDVIFTGIDGKTFTISISSPTFCHPHLANSAFPRCS